MSERRNYNTEWARRRRLARWAGKARTSRTCPHRHGSGRCGAVLLDETLNGKHVVRCPACERRLAGVCADCPRPVEGRRGSAVRCAMHKRNRRDEQVQRCRERNREEINKRQTAARRRLPAKKREQINARKKLWRKANPDRVRLHKRREALSGNPHRLEWHRQYNARRAEEKRADARRRYYEAHPDRPHPTCRDCRKEIEWTPPGRPPVRCVECVPPSVAARRKEKIEKWVPPIESTQEKPLRTCLTCDRVVTGRKKRCTRCKAADAAAARAAMGAAA